MIGTEFYMGEGREDYCSANRRGQGRGGKRENDLEERVKKAQRKARASRGIR